MLKYTRALITVLTSLIATLLMLDALLYWLDPIGLADLAYALNAQARYRIADDTGFALRDGVQDWHYFTVTIDDGWRVVPASTPDGDCRIAFLGDSVTFGFGVEDDETFVNRVAAVHPGVEFINAARHGYNIGNIARVYEEVQADGYVWLMFSNDARPDATFTAGGAITDIPATAIYLLWALDGAPTQGAFTEDRPRFMQIVPQLIQDDVLIFAFEDNPLASQLNSIVTLPMYQHTVSYIDGHPNAASHAQIAAHMMPALAEFIPERCNG